LSYRIFFTFYKSLFGQKLNFDKLKDFSSANISQANRDKLKQILGMGEMVGQHKYLGLPTCTGCSIKLFSNCLNNEFGIGQTRDGETVVIGRA